MPRKRKLDPYVTSFVDKHGKEWFRFRRRGVSFYLPPPGSQGYKEAYERGMAGFKPDTVSRAKPKSVGDLVERFYRSAKFNRPGDSWKTTVRSFIEPFREEFADDRVSDFTFEHIEAVLKRAAIQEVQENGRKRGGTFAVKRLHEQLIRLFGHAKRLGWIESNPAKEADLPVIHVTKGFHTWTEAEIAQFKARWDKGTKPRLALEIALWTGLRRADVAKLGPHNIINGRVVGKAGKTGKDFNLKLWPDMAEVLPDHGPTFLLTEYGKPFTDAGLGNWFREQCDKAGLPNCTMHGLRKALTRRSVEGGANTEELKRIGQWANSKQVAVYAADAEHERLADSALRKANKRATESMRRKNPRQTTVKNPEKSPILS